MAIAERAPNSRAFWRGSSRAIALALALSLPASCTSVSSEDIQLWKTTEKGPAKLSAALTNSKVEPRLRVEAALALVDIGRADEVETALAAASPEERRALAQALMPPLVAGAEAPLPERALGYRDVLFSTRPFVDPEAQKQIDRTLFSLIAKDLRAGRVRNGRQSVEKMLSASPGAANEMLVGLLAEPLEVGPLATVAELFAKRVDQTSDDANREKGALHLVARARQELAKGRPVADSTWRSIGLLGGAAGRTFLAEQIRSGKHDAATAAARALQQRREPAVLGLALEVAADAKADRTVRDEMFGVVESIGGLTARDALLAIIRTDREDIVRYRAFESLLAVTKADAVVDGLDAFPVAASYKKVDVQDLLVKLIEKVGSAALPQLRKGLGSRSVLTRMTAVMTLEDMGTAADEAALGRLAKDPASPKGFPPGDSVGKEALLVAAVVRSRS